MLRSFRRGMLFHAESCSKTVKNLLAKRDQEMKITLVIYPRNTRHFYVCLWESRKDLMYGWISFAYFVFFYSPSSPAPKFLHSFAETSFMSLICKIWQEYLANHQREVLLHQLFWEKTLLHLALQNYRMKSKKKIISITGLLGVLLLLRGGIAYFRHTKYRCTQDEECVMSFTDPEKFQICVNKDYVASAKTECYLCLKCPTLSCSCVNNRCTRSDKKAWCRETHPRK